ADRIAEQLRADRIAEQRQPPARRLRRASQACAVFGVLVPLLAVLLTATPALQLATDVRLVAQQARWTGLGPPDGFADDREPWFLISGEIENSGTLPLAHVRMVYELLADGQVVARESGYNRRAEALRDPAVESGEVDAASLHLPPLGPGERDSFRMIFLRSDTPRFDAWHVRVEAVTRLTGDAATGAPTAGARPTPRATP
ncbi:MAG: hypothetical protein ABI629_07370, partial [bacterium]